MELLIGAIVSVATHYLQKWFGTSEYPTLAVLAGVSILAGVVWTLFGNMNLWTTAYQAFVYAAAVYAVILRRFPSIAK